MISHATPTQKSLPPTRAVFGYFPVLEFAKPYPAFLHSQLLKAGNKTGIASFWVCCQGISRGCSLSPVCQPSGQRFKGPVGTALAELLCCPHVCQGGTVPASLLPAPCHSQPSQCYCHRAPTSCCTFTHSFMEVSVIRSHCGLFG